MLAGGQSLLPLLSMRLAAPTTLVDINRVPGLDTVEATGDGVTVGALVRHNALLHDDAAARVQPLLARATANVAHPAIRNRGTTVGSIAHADPSGEMTSVLALTDGSVSVATPDGVETSAGATSSSARWRPRSTVPRSSPPPSSRPCRRARAPRSPRSPAARATTRSAARASSSRWTPTAASSAVRAAYISVGPDARGARPHRRRDRPAGRQRGLGRAPARSRARLVDPDTDLHASADYRRLLVGVLTERMLAGRCG